MVRIPSAGWRGNEPEPEPKAASGPCGYCERMEQRGKGKCQLHEEKAHGDEVTSGAPGICWYCRSSVGGVCAQHEPHMAYRVGEWGPEVLFVPIGDDNRGTVVEYTFVWSVSRARAVRDEMVKLCRRNGPPCLM